MAGQDATLSIKEAKAQIARTECGVSDHQGPKKGDSQTELMKKTKHQG